MFLSSNSLEEIFYTSLELLGVKNFLSSQWEKEWLSLNRRYGSREYHNREHLLAMTERLKELGFEKRSYPELWIALIYHDIVFNPGDSQNEHHSAYRAVRFLDSTGEVSSGSRERIVDLIMCTKDHKPPKDDLLAQALVDADLYQLATKAYFTNAIKLRNEFDMFSDEEWVKGRIAWIESFLGRRKIFHLQSFDKDRRTSKELDDAARVNMNCELTRLEELSL